MTSESEIYVEEDQVCRICFEDSSELFSPCKCCGSVKYVHVACLQKWVLKQVFDTFEIYKVQNYRDSDRNLYAIQCEICSGKIYFKMERTKVYRKCEEMKKQLDSKKFKFICYLISFIVAFTVVSVLIAEGIQSIEEISKSIFCFAFAVVLLCSLARLAQKMVEEFFLGVAISIEFIKKRKQKMTV